MVTISSLLQKLKVESWKGHLCVFFCIQEGSSLNPPGVEIPSYGKDAICSGTLYLERIKGGKKTHMPLRTVFK